MLWDLRITAVSVLTFSTNFLGIKYSLVTVCRYLQQRLRGARVSEPIFINIIRLSCKFGFTLHIFLEVCCIAYVMQLAALPVVFLMALAYPVHEPR